MAELKRRTVLLSTGKQIKLYGNSLAIGSGLEIGEGAAPGLFAYLERQPAPKTGTPAGAVTGENKDEKPKAPAPAGTASVLNPHGLNREEICELADYAIRQWMLLKDRVRKYGTEDPKVFIKET
jgi:hypothetical protein